MRYSNATIAGVRNGDAARHTEARAPSRLLVGRRRRFRQLAAGRLVRGPRFRRCLSGVHSFVDDPFPRHTVLSAGAPVIGWHNYLAWRICARRQGFLSGVGGGSSRLPPGGLLGSHLLGGTFLGRTPSWTITGPRLSRSLLVYPSLDGMTTSLGAFARAVKASCRASSAVPAACRRAACSRATS